MHFVFTDSKGFIYAYCLVYAWNRSVYALSLSGFTFSSLHRKETNMNQIEYAGSGRVSREENALRKSANAPPLIRAGILRHFGKQDEADALERRSLSATEYAALQEERAGANENDEDIKLRLRLAAQAV